VDHVILAFGDYSSEELVTLQEIEEVDLIVGKQQELMVVEDL